MAAWIDTRWFWTLLILTLCGEFLLPCLLARKDPAYRPGTMAVSVLGRRGGPVARVYRLWLALVFFTLFVLSDKDRFQGTAVAREGLWEQLCLAAMYVPLLLDAIVHLISAP